MAEIPYGRLDALAAALGGWEAIEAAYAAGTPLVGPGSGGGVTTFNTRSGAVTLSKADVTGTGLAAADVSADASGAAAAAQVAAIAASAQGLVPTAVKTTNYSAAAADFVPVDASGGVVTVTLPSAPADKTRVGVKIIAQAGTPNTVTVARGGSDVFNKAGGSTSLSLSALFQSVLLQYQSSTGIWYAQSTDYQLPASVVSVSSGTAPLVDAGTATIDQNLLYYDQASGRFKGKVVSGAGNFTVDITKAPYNANNSGKQYINGSITSGQAVLTCASAAFALSDVGRTIIVTGAGAAGASLVTTVAAFTSTTSITLTADASATTTTAGIAIGSDCTSIIQQAINDMVTSGVGGTIFFPKGVYLLTGALRSGTVTGTSPNVGKSWTYNGQILFPARNISNPHLTVALISETAPGGPQWAFGTGQQGPSPSGATLISSITTGCVFDVISDSAGNPFSQGFTAITGQFGQIAVRVPPGSAATAINGRYLASLNMRDSACDVLGLSITGTSGNGVGVWLPGFANSGGLSLHSVQILGYGTGVVVGEHALLETCYIQSCFDAITANGNSNQGHLVTFRTTTVQNCHNVINTNGGNFTVAGDITVESNIVHIAETSGGGALQGELFLHQGVGSGGLTLRPTNNNPYKVNIKTGFAPAGWMNSPVKDGFARLSASSSNPDLTDGSNHFYQVMDSLTFGVSGSQGVGAGFGAAGCLIPNSWRSYAVSGQIKLAATTASIGWMIRSLSSNLNYIGAVMQISGGTNNVVILKKVGYTTLATSAAQTLVGGSTHDFAVTWEQKVPGAAAVIEAFLDGVSVVTYTLSGAEVTAYKVATTDLVYAGVAYGVPSISDDGSSRWLNMSIDRI